jgi:hypothetical protein
MVPTTTCCLGIPHLVTLPACCVPGPDGGYRCLAHWNVIGNDVSAFWIPLEAECRTACSGNNECTYYVYVTIEHPELGPNGDIGGCYMKKDYGTGLLGHTGPAPAMTTCLKAGVGGT